MFISKMIWALISIFNKVLKMNLKMKAGIKKVHIHLQPQDGRRYVDFPIYEWFYTIINKLSSVEIKFDDEIWTLIVLTSLINKWESMRMVMSTFDDKSTLKFDNIRDLILANEVHKRDVGEISSKSRFEQQMTCWNCDKIGYIKRDCWNLK